MCKFRDFEKYEVFEDGRIWSYKSNKFLKPYTNKKGYQQIQLSDNAGKIKTYSVHRVVWESVTGSPIPNNLQINHRSEVKTENMITNLELVSPKENCNFGTRNKRIGNTNSKVLTNNTKISKQVGAFNKNGELVFTFPSTQEAGRNGFIHSAVAACCRGELKTHKGFEWRYI